MIFKQSKLLWLQALKLPRTFEIFADMRRKRKISSLQEMVDPRMPVWGLCMQKVKWRPSRMIRWSWNVSLELAAMATTAVNLVESQVSWHITYEKFQWILCTGIYIRSLQCNLQGTKKSRSRSRLQLGSITNVWSVAIQYKTFLQQTLSWLPHNIPRKR